MMKSTTPEVAQLATVAITTPQRNNSNATPLNKSSTGNDKKLDTDDDKESNAAATTTLKVHAKQPDNANNQPKTAHSTSTTPQYNDPI
jgi:hypothetical protein